jgi:hypothetical protein
MTQVLAPVYFDAPLVNPSPQSLYAATSWTDETGASRWAQPGVIIRPFNYGGEEAAGVWGADWCGQPGSGSDGQLKFGVRPDTPAAFPPFTMWAYDECDPSAFSRDEILRRVQQIFRLQEPVLAETMFGADLATAAASIAVTRPDVRYAVAYLEGELAKTNTLGVIHANPEAAALEFGLVLPSGGTLRTPLGHQWVFGGGYVDTLGDMLVATSPLFGWRDPVQVRTVLDLPTTLFAAVAERSVVIGYEKLVAAVHTSIEEGS